MDRGLRAGMEGEGGTTQHMMSIQKWENGNLCMGGVCRVRIEKVWWGGGGVVAT